MQECRDRSIKRSPTSSPNPQRSEGFHPRRRQGRRHGGGLAATGKDRSRGKLRILAEYRDQMRDIVKQGLVDIMLMSASTSELLTINERLFENSRVTPAVRANDTTDIHLPAGGTYAGEPSRPFRSATIEQIQSGKVKPTPTERGSGADLGSIRSRRTTTRIRLCDAARRTRNFASKPRQRGFGISWKCSIRTPAAIAARSTWPIHQRPDRAHPRRRARAAAGRFFSRSPITARRRWRNWSAYDPR